MVAVETEASSPRQRGGGGNELVEALALYETTKEICSRLDLDQVLQAIVRRANELLGGDMAYLATADEKHKVLRMRAVHNVTSKRFQELVMPYGVGLGGAIASQRRPLTTSDYLHDSHLHHAAHIDEAVREEAPTGSAVGVPVEFEDRLLAVLFVAKRRKTRFTRHQVTLLSSLANSAAIAMNNAQIYARLARSMTIHQNLMEMALADRGPQPIADTLAELVGGPVVLLDWATRLLATTSVGGQELVAPARDVIEEAAVSCLGAYATSGAFEMHGVQGRVITVGGQTEGYLLVEPSDDDGELAAVAIEQAAMVFALELAKMRSAEQAEAELRGDLLDGLFAESLTHEAALSRQAHRLGVDLHAPHVVAAVRPHRPIAEDGQLDLWRRISHVAAHVCRRPGGGMVVRRGESLVLLVRADSVDEAETAARTLVRESRRAELPELVIGVGSPCRQLTDYARSFEEASRAAEAAQRLPRLAPVARFSSLEYHELVLGTRPSPELVRIAERELAALAEYDARHRGGSLVKTVRVYLECCGNLEATARQLAVHPNTLRGRVARIEELLDRDLQEASTRLDLQLAFATLDLTDR